MDIFVFRIIFFLYIQGEFFFGHKGFFSALGGAEIALFCSLFFGFMVLLVCLVFKKFKLQFLVSNLIFLIQLSILASFFEYFDSVDNFVIPSLAKNMPYSCAFVIFVGACMIGFCCSDIKRVGVIRSVSAKLTAP
ncbi:MAG TPA: hypothetical protein VLB90_01840 [Pseudomonadales bacterium]|nr:hypothetical protein [Pseudomonadales bacterium]